MVTIGLAVAQEACRARLAIGSSKNTVSSGTTFHALVSSAILLVLLDVVSIRAKHLPFSPVSTCVTRFTFFRGFAPSRTVMVDRTLNFLPFRSLATIIATRTSNHHIGTSLTVITICAGCWLN